MTESAKLSEEVFIKVSETKPITLKEWFSNFRKDTQKTIDTPENRLALQNRLADFKKYWRTIHPIIPKIKSMKVIIYVDEKELKKE